MERADHQYLNGQYLACEVRTEMYAILTKSGLSFIYKMIREILSMQRADSGYLHKFEIKSCAFEDDEFENEGKTNNVHRMCLLLAYRVSTHMHTHVTHTR